MGSKKLWGRAGKCHSCSGVRRVTGRASAQMELGSPAVEWPGVASALRGLGLGALRLKSQHKGPPGLVKVVFVCLALGLPDLKASPGEGGHSTGLGCPMSLPCWRGTGCGAQGTGPLPAWLPAPPSLAK